MAHVVCEFDQRTDEVAVVEEGGREGALGDELVAEHLEAPVREGDRAVVGRRLVGQGVLLDKAALDGLDARNEEGRLDDVADGEGEDEEVRELEGVEQGGVHLGGERLHEKEDEGDDAELCVGVLLLLCVSFFWS